jgi:hypothetical protein
MTMMRQRFDVDTDTGRWSDIGPPFFGAILQMAWNPSTGDTGGDLEVALKPLSDGDTGPSWVVYSDNDCLGTDFIKAPRQHAHGLNGIADTGSPVPVVGAGDRLRVKVTPGGAAVVGKLYIWSAD